MMRDFLKTKLRKKQLQSALICLREFEKCSLESKGINFEEYRMLEEFEKCLVYLTEGTLPVDDFIATAKVCYECGKIKGDIDKVEGSAITKFPQSMFCQYKGGHDKKTV